MVLIFLTVFVAGGAKISPKPSPQMNHKQIFSRNTDEAYERMYGIRVSSGGENDAQDEPWMKNNENSSPPTNAEVEEADLLNLGDFSISTSKHSANSIGVANDDWTADFTSAPTNSLPNAAANKPKQYRERKVSQDDFFLDFAGGVGSTSASNNNVRTQIKSTTPSDGGNDLLGDWTTATLLASQNSSAGGTFLGAPGGGMHRNVSAPSFVGQQQMGSRSAGPTPMHRDPFADLTAFSGAGPQSGENFL